MNKVFVSGICIILLSSILFAGCSTTDMCYDSDCYGSADACAVPEAAYGLAMAKESGTGTPHKDSQKASVSSKPQNRLVIYHGSLNLLVDNISETTDKTLAVVKNAGGYMQSMYDKIIVVKIPAAKFEEVVAKIEDIGEVTYKSIVGEDVTDAMRDLKIRLKTAEKIQERLVSLLDMAKSVKDALEIERELGRVTETIELLKGQMRVLDDRIAFSTLTVKFNSPLPQQSLKQTIPFPWVLQLGEDLANGSGSINYYPSHTWKYIKFELPDSFAKYEEEKNLTRATSADGVMLKVSRHDNVDGGDLKFWSTYIKRALTARRAIKIKSVSEAQVHRRKNSIIISGVKDIGGRKYGYMLAVALTDNCVTTYEAWGEIDDFRTAEEAIRKSMGSLRL